MLDGINGLVEYVVIIVWVAVKLIYHNTVKCCIGNSLGEAE